MVDSFQCQWVGVRFKSQHMVMINIELPKKVNQLEMTIWQPHVSCFEFATCPKNEQTNTDFLGEAR